MMASTQFEMHDPNSPYVIELADRGAMPPPYVRDSAEVESILSATSSASLPEYDDDDATAAAAAGPSSSGSRRSRFHATSSMQIESKGLPAFTLPLPPRPDPIPVYAVDASSGALGAKVYESIRRSRGSGSCVLFRGRGDAQDPVCSTIYRFGPGRPPKICLLGPGADVANLGIDNEPPVGVEAFEVRRKGPVTRAVSIRTDMGTFEWRHAGRRERREVGADSLLLLEHVTHVAIKGGKREEVRRRVAQFVRNAEFRTQGTGRGSAGNGGRLMMDLGAWADAKDQKQRVEAFVVASCIVMLKREVDRRRS